MYYLCQEILKYMIMKKGLLFIVVLFSFVGTWSQVVFKNDEVTVSKLKDKTWVFETWDFTTMYLLEGNVSLINLMMSLSLTHIRIMLGVSAISTRFGCIVTIVYLSRNEQ